jgi:hypothetical protein
MYEGRLAYRSRPRRLMVLLFAALFVIIILFSRQPFVAEPEPHESRGAALGFHATSPIAQHRHVEPVVFALVMYSESSATEGAILMKVLLPILIAVVS